MCPVFFIIVQRFYPYRHVTSYPDTDQSLLFIHEPVEFCDVPLFFQRKPVAQFCYCFIYPLQGRRVFIVALNRCFIPGPILSFRLIPPWSPSLCRMAFCNLFNLAFNLIQGVIYVNVSGLSRIDDPTGSPFCPAWRLTFGG